MSSPEVIVFAILVSKKGKAGEAKHLLGGLVPPTRAEAGCITYNLHQDCKDENVFIFHEIWNSSQDFDSHVKSTHVQTATSKFSDIFDSVDVKRMTRVWYATNKSSIVNVSFLVYTADRYLHIP